ncbi:YlzJ-like family protein [Bacillus shivajii]|uniref:YlzJ-like family protein n=1 Tax=Bacillus shivajii TaxID=1983719 RepID=UPI001CF9AB77|nr:YlzJ-like family protein [Bacillus shivajii]UCZ51668.1 YlzJ-like family protein [Bacillus shivajii]
MILYTYQPAESVFPVEEAAYNKQEMVSIPGGQLLVERQEDQTYRIVRLFSTDPNLYLNSQYEPGKMYQKNN